MDLQVATWVTIVDNCEDVNGKLSNSHQQSVISKGDFKHHQ